MHKVIVIGGDHHNTLGMVRSLGSKGILPDVYVVKPNSSAVSLRSKYIRDLRVFKTDQEVVDCLLEDKPRYKGEKAILLIGSDHAEVCIDKQSDALRDYYVFFNAGGNLSDLMSKESMCQLAEEIGLNVPTRIVLNISNMAGAKNVVGGGINYPCITKAISSLDGGKSDTTICKTKEELEAFLKTPGLCPTIQIEKYIEKEIEFQFIGLSLDGGDTIVIPGHSHIDRPNGIQNTYFFEYKENDSSFQDTLEKAKCFIKKTGYSGIFSIEFLRGKDGKDYFLEMNFRNDGNAICVTDAGYNLPYIWYLYATGQDYKAEIGNSVFKPVIYCPEIFYTLQCSFGEVPFLTWFRNILRANSFTNYYKGDSLSLYWVRFSIWALVQLWRGILIRIGLRQAPKESIG